MAHALMQYKCSLQEVEARFRFNCILYVVIWSRIFGNLATTPNVLPSSNNFVFNSFSQSILILP